MKTNLDVLKDEIQAMLAEAGIAVFRGFCRNVHSRPGAYWDTSRDPEFRHFLDVALQMKVKMVVFNYIAFSSGMVEEAQDSLEDSDLPAEERRAYERKLQEIASYQGFTCALQVSYDYDGRSFAYEVQADWYAEFLGILDELDVFAPGDDDEEDEDSMGGYFSRN
jgi:hypothetical protein